MTITWVALGRVWKTVLGILAIALLCVSLLYVWGEYRNSTKVEAVQVVPWSPSEDSPFQCFAAMEGDSVRALSCLPR